MQVPNLEVDELEFQNIKRNGTLKGVKRKDL
jgi:hypothetical protein